MTELIAAGLLVAGLGTLRGMLIVLDLRSQIGDAARGMVRILIEQLILDKVLLLGMLGTLCVAWVLPGDNLDAPAILGLLAAVIVAQIVFLSRARRWMRGR